MADGEVKTAQPGKSLLKEQKSCFSLFCNETYFPWKHLRCHFLSLKVKVRKGITGKRNVSRPSGERGMVSACTVGIF